jgi:hypothetical protein
MSIQLTIEVQEAQMILGALAKLPLENVLDTWFKVKTQAETQLQAQQAPAPIEVADAPAQTMDVQPAE